MTRKIMQQNTRDHSMVLKGRNIEYRQPHDNKYKIHNEFAR